MFTIRSFFFQLQKHGTPRELVGTFVETMSVTGFLSRCCFLLKHSYKQTVRRQQTVWKAVAETGDCLTQPEERRGEEEVLNQINNEVVIEEEDILTIQSHAQKNSYGFLL